MKKHLPLLVLSLSIASNGFCESYEDSDTHMRNLENRLCALETRNDRCCVINPPARPSDPDLWGFYLSIDPFVWQAHVNGLGIGTETKASTTFFNSRENRVQNLNWDWDWGFRLGLGLNQCHDGWDTLLQWTYWKSNASRGFSINNTDTFFPRIGAPRNSVSPNPTRVDAKWELHLNMLDLENGREFYVSRYLTLRPFAGLRTAWIKQEYDVAFKQIINPTPPPNNQLDVDQVCRFWGFGIRGGLDTQWGICDGWSIFANYSSSLLYNYYSVRHNETSSLNGENPQDILRERDFYHAGTSITDMQLGVRFDWFSCDECYHLGIEGGWENHYFPGQNQFIFFADEGMPGKFFVNQGDLATQGFFAKVRFDF